MMDLVHFLVIKSKRLARLDLPFIVIFLCCLFSSINIEANEWMQDIVQAEFRDIRPFKKTDVKTAWEELSEKKPYFLFYQIKNRVVYGKRNRMHALLSAICAKYPLKDIDLIYCIHDYTPQSVFTTDKKYPPILTSAKKVGDRNVILFADWYYDINDPNVSSQTPQANVNPNSWEQLIPAINAAHENTPWEDRASQMIWRGGMNGGTYTRENWTKKPRGRLVYLSQHKQLDFLDAAFSSHDPERCSDVAYFNRMLKSSQLTPVQHVQYKYQIDIDGVTATFTALPWKLLSGSLVFKHNSMNIMWFHYALKPFEHFIPVARYLKDLPDQVMWAMEHDKEAQKIAANGREFALTHLMPEHILLYCYLVLSKYASLQTK